MSETQQPSAPPSAPPVHPAMAPGALPMMETEEWRELFATHVFRTKDSLKNFIRSHREELIEAGALGTPVGRMMVHPQRFEAMVQQIGQRMAASRSYTRRSDLQ